MRCPSCSHDNPDAAKFCAECAAPLAPKCGSCGARSSWRLPIARAHAAFTQMGATGRARAVTTALERTATAASTSS
jgi:predicted amidophosphoribosyltransferase